MYGRLSSQMHSRALGRFDAFLVAAMVPLFIAALIADYAYWTSFQVEWSNFASWLVAGGLVFGAAALVFAASDVSLDGGKGKSLVYSLLLLLTWLLGFINAFVHARDAWAVMPSGLVLSLVVALLACVTAFVGFAHLPGGRAP